MDLEIIIKLLLSIALSSLIGFEREKLHRGAGLRTHILVCLASTIITIVSLSVESPADPTRIAAAIVTGIGFIGAGTIIQFKGKILGITTAASLFLISGIGIAIGLAQYFLAILSTVFGYIILIEGIKLKAFFFKK
ncbi:MgtC/SapB family protein [Candidatus Woesearchaeota archaeon]|nr:MgtC/SapB family protein [Candidatus Woesearchaeota archaeon]